MRVLLVFVIAAGGCVLPRPEQEIETAEVKAKLQDPALVHELFFGWIGSQENYGKVHDKLLSRDAKAAMSYDAFCLGVTQARNLVPEGFRHLVGGMRQHKVAVPKSGVTWVRWCNVEMGYSRDIKLVATTVAAFVFWYVELTREDLESLKDALLAWYRRQKEADGDQRLVHPPHWRYASVGRCACQP